MSTEVALFGGAKVPAYLKGVDLDATTKALAGGGGGGGRRISIKGGVFRMIVDGKQVAESDERAMNVIIVAAAPSVNRQFYEGKYEEGVAASADCYSEDGKTPSKDSAKPQAKSCSDCPQNISGSGQGDSRACRYQQRLAVVLEGEIGGPVYQLALPATSLFGKGEANNTKLPLQAYVRYLVSNGMPVTAVVTELRFDTKAATPKLTFKATRPLDEDEFNLAQEQGASPDAQQAIKLTVFKQDGEKAVKAEVEKPKAPKPVEAEVEEKEPTVTKAAKAAPAAPAGKRPASAVIAEWDDE